MFFVQSVAVDGEPFGGFGREPLAATAFAKPFDRVRLVTFSKQEIRDKRNTMGMDGISGGFDWCQRSDDDTVRRHASVVLHADGNLNQGGTP